MTAKRWHYTVVNRLIGGAITHIRLTGTIDEGFNPEIMLGDVRGHVLLDCGRVERISSFGVRKWMEFTRAVPPSVHGIYLLHLPPFFVDQLNMVEGFAGVATVLSFLAPYTCPTCNEDRTRLVDARADRDVIMSGQAPAHNCPVCGSQLQFADLPSEFFDYVRAVSPGPLDSAVERYLQFLKPTLPPDVGHNVKVVEGDISFIRFGTALKKDMNVRRLAAGLEGRVVFDFSAVAEVEEGAEPRLGQVVTAASDGASLYLWKVPPVVLRALAEIPEPRFKIATLFLPGECRSCGNKMPQRVDAPRFVAAGEADEEILLDCPICGGIARMPLLKELQPFVASVAAEGPFEDFASLEPKALSHYFSQSSAGSTPSRPGAQAPNTEAANKLQVIRRLGQGGMAEVFLAKQQGLKGFEKYVVIKKVLESFANSPEFVEMLFAEARANARLNHPNIVQTYDVGMMNGSAYIAMEYVRGPDVKKLLQAVRRTKQFMPVEIALRIIADTAAGLHYAHSYVDPSGKPHPMVHRDVSPHNILISLDGVVKLSDFGIAKVQGEGDATQAGTFKGKIGYVSPEAVSGMPLDGRNDVFALGVTLFELLTGQLPFRKDSEAATLRAIVHEQPPSPATINPTVVPDVAAVVSRALEKNVGRRTPSAGQLRNEIEALMGRLGMTATAFTVAQYARQFFPEYANSMDAGGNSATAVKVPETVAPPPSAPAEANGPSEDSVPVLDMLDELLEGGAPDESRTMSGVTPSGLKAVPPTPSPRAAPPVAPPRAAPPVQKPAAAAQPARAPAPQALRGQNLTPVAAARPQPAAAPLPQPKPPEQQARPAQARAPQSGQHAPVASAPRPQSGSHPPVPAAAVRPPQSGSHPPVPPAAARPPQPAPQPAPQPPPPAPAPAAVAAPAVPVTTPATPSAPKSRKKTAIALSAVGGILLIAAGGFAMFTGKKTVEVLNLEADETLFIGGLKADPSNLTSLGTAAQIVAVARDGRLNRFGNAPVDTRLDTKALISAPAGFDNSPDNQAQVQVITSQQGCIVMLEGEQNGQRTPASLKFAAGKQTRLDVACQGRQLWSTELLAIPGQNLVVSATP